MYTLREYFKGILEATTFHETKESAYAYQEKFDSPGTEWELSDDADN